MHRPLRLTIDRSAIEANWRWLQQLAGVPAGAAIKADGYGLGARETMDALVGVGCREFFVATWAEADALGSVAPDIDVIVLHGVGPDDSKAALASARPCLNSPEQVARWKEIGAGRPCDVMIDTGMNRLGLRPTEIDVLEGVTIQTLHSHLACADEDSPMNGMQLERFRAVASAVPAKRYALCNSAGVGLGSDYSFDLVRPGISIYGGIQRPEFTEHIRQVVRVEAQVGISSAATVV